jgi:hypothetical protein
VGSDDGDDGATEPCLYCIGGVTNCCDGAYSDDSYPERECERCVKLYRGPAVYCCFECAVADA